MVELGYEGLRDVNFAFFLHLKINSYDLSYRPYGLAPWQNTLVVHI